MPASRPVLERLWEKVNFTPGCLLWTGAVDEWGYGRFWSGEKNVRVHHWLSPVFVLWMLKP